VPPIAAEAMRSYLFVVVQPLVVKVGIGLAERFRLNHKDFQLVIVHLVG
jgi:hypothetical protein